MKEFVVGLDMNVAHVLVGMRSEAATNFFLFITQLGNASFILIFSLAVAGYFWWRTHSYFLPFLVSIIGSSLSVTIIKEVIDRARPGTDIAFYAEHLFSFPSGHAASAVAAFGFVAYALMRMSQGSVTKKLVLGTATILILLIAFSRLYLGVHYLSDVIAGILVGGFWVVVGALLHHYVRRI
ncbi:MAG TPA: phosphatase PAP2 family protein [Candidatus Paceibacterota bacterium]|nr:phosphatase PAP2 family protein [Candidatus Paceibacterota bacterium]